MNKVAYLTILAFFMVSCVSEEVSEKIEPQQVQLPQPRYDSDTSVEEAIFERRSIREYINKPLSMEDVSQLLWSAQGITDKIGKRASPSAGETYPLELYLVVGDVAGIDQGVYLYEPESHSVSLHKAGDVRKELAMAGLGQVWIARAPANIVMGAVYERTTKVYGARGIRYVDMEVGHAAQNVYLQSVTLGLGTVVVGAFSDELVKEVLELPEEVDPLYIIPVGKK